MSYILLDKIHFSYGSNCIFDDFSLTIEKGEFHSLLGPSGCGKSTLIHLIGGFLKLDQGKIQINGNDISKLPPESREIGMVFQDACLFPHLNVHENIRYGLSKKESPEKVKEMLTLVDLEEKENCMPHELSGGEQKRVSLARALVKNPKLLLFDESFSSLDEHLRFQLRDQVKKIVSNSQTTCLLITHSVDEALAMSDCITVLTEKSRQTGSSENLFKHPVHPSIVQILKSGIVLDQDIFPHHGNKGKLYLPYSSFSLSKESTDHSVTVIKGHQSQRGWIYEIKADFKSDPFPIFTFEKFDGSKAYINIQYPEDPVYFN